MIPIQWVQGDQSQGNAPLQEDYFEVNPEKGIFILADGFGGSAGKEASKVAVQSVRQFLEQEAGDLDITLPFELRSYFSLAGNVLFNAISFANQKVNQHNKGKNLLSSGGASLVAGYLNGKLLSIANVGSCSVFLKRAGAIKELINPKSLGRQTNPFVGDAEGGLIPLMSLGTAKQLEPEIVEVEVQPGDLFLFKTAGLSVDGECGIQLLTLNSAPEIRQFFDKSQLETNASLICVSL